MVVRGEAGGRREGEKRRSGREWKIRKKITRKEVEMKKTKRSRREEKKELEG